MQTSSSSSSQVQMKCPIDIALLYALIEAGLPMFVINQREYRRTQSAGTESAAHECHNLLLTDSA
jgi:hypothetical protein